VCQSTVDGEIQDFLVHLAVCLILIDQVLGIPVDSIAGFQQPLPGFLLRPYRTPISFQDLGRLLRQEGLTARTVGGWWKVGFD
jgi:hypothetical protein